MSVKSYKDLIVWQRAMDLVEEIYRISKEFPKEEIYGLTNQMRRAAVSIPSNIAEGQARRSTAEFKRFLSISMGSLAELETQILIAQRLNYLPVESMTKIMATHQEVSKMLSALFKKLATGH